MSSFELIDIPISLALLNCLRTFSHCSHKFTSKFLLAFQKAFSDCTKTLPKFNEFTESEKDKVILAVHYYLALISNINHLIQALNIENDVEELDVKEINSTNIFNVQSLYKALKIQTNESQEVNSNKSPETNHFDSCSGNGINHNICSFRDFSIKLCKTETKGEDKCLYISYEQVNFISFTVLFQKVSNKKNIKQCTYYEQKVPLLIVLIFNS